LYINGGVLDSSRLGSFITNRSYFDRKTSPATVSAEANFCSATSFDNPEKGK
jgi:hypothetical protein